MEKEELQKNIALYYSKLPPKLQEVFSSMKWLETLQGIDTKYNLTEAQKELLGTETTLVLLCIIPINEYVEKLTKDLMLPAETVDNIITEINDGIMQPILPELVNAFDANIEALNKENPEVDANLDNRFDKLTPEMKKLLEDSNYQNTLYEIGKVYNLNVEQMGEVEKTVVDLMTGSIKSEEFSNSLRRNLNLPEEITTKLSNDINEKLLKAIREKMKGADGVKEVSVDEKQVLQSAGIEILSEDLTIPELNSGHPPVKSLARDEVASPQDLGKATSNGIHPIIMDKLSGPVQNPPVKTIHSAENLSKTPETKKYTVDPYRELPE